MPGWKHIARAMAILGCVAVAGRVHADGQVLPLTTEISSEHPLFLFADGGSSLNGLGAYAQHILDTYSLLPPTIKPYAAIGMSLDGLEPGARAEAFGTALPPLQAAGVPLVARVWNANLDLAPPKIEQVRLLLDSFTTVKGIEVFGLHFDRYPPPGGMDNATAAEAAWLSELIDLAARYGRFVYLPMEGLAWPRLMANNATSQLYAKIAQLRGYVFPACLFRGGQNLAAQQAMLGSWLEGAVIQWGVAADSRWYSDAAFIAPGRYGAPTDPAAIPSSVYRAMILDGAMTGAAVYAFPNAADLWAGEARRHWDAAIAPALTELLDKGLIAREDFVRKRALAACQLVPASNPIEFHLNLRDIDGAYDMGLLIQGAFGMEKAGQVPELILNRGDRFWVPLLSPHAPPAAVQSFSHVIRAGTMRSAADWSALLSKYAEVDGEGTAFISKVGRGIFVMNTRENEIERQTFRIPEAPAPVHGLEARRENNAVVLTWPFREGDVSYNVFKRVLPSTVYVRVASGIEDRNYADTAAVPGETAAYAITALTSEMQPYDGTVNYGEYLALSVVESRIAEEAVMQPMLASAPGAPFAPPLESLSVGGETDAPPPEQAQKIEAILERMTAFETALQTENLPGIPEFYTDSYEDPQGWGKQYVRRAWQWLFEGYDAIRTSRQERHWDFSAYESEKEVSVLEYFRVTAIALSDPQGLRADIPLSIPRTDTREIWFTWHETTDGWRIARTNPAFPNWRDLLAPAVSPYTPLPPAPDEFGMKK